MEKECLIAICVVALIAETCFKTLCIDTHDMGNAHKRKYITCSFAGQFDPVWNCHTQSIQIVS